MSNNYLSDLNKEQRRAVRHGTKQPKMIDRALLVIAGAGTGKTKTLTYRVAHLIANGVDPQRILFGVLIHQKADGRLPPRPVHANAAAIDIGATLHIAAVGPDRDPEPVRSFGTWSSSASLWCW